MAINGLGALLTGVVLVIVVFEKFVDGAYLVVILIPVLVGDDAVHQPPVRGVARAALAIEPGLVVAPPNREERAIVPVPSLNRAVVRAVNVARSITDDVSAVYISESPEESSQMRERWERQVPGVPLVIVESPVPRAGRPAASRTSTCWTARGRRTSPSRSRSS